MLIDICLFLNLISFFLIFILWSDSMGHDKSKRKRIRYEQSGDQIYVQRTLKYEKYEPQN